MPCFESPSRETWRWHGWISVHARALHRHTTRHVTSCTHFDWIFELMRSLRCNYALYRDTMPLTSIAFYITASQPHPHTWCTYKMMVGLVILYLIKWCSELCHTHTSHILTIVTDLISDSIFTVPVQSIC